MNTPLTTESLLEALIFAAPQPVSVEDLARVAGISVEEIEAHLKTMSDNLLSRGVRLQRNKNRVQMVSAPEAAPQLEQLLGLEVNLRLSQAALETLAIVAYAQPVTRPQVESIRGVNSDSVLRTLLAAGLIEELGRADTLGRPMRYGTTFEFLQQFGLEKPDDLPPLEKPEAASESA
ncbi:MAG: SMC-Scp complex subunit ScpB [Anaerolineae bacterium]|nr:SMC-Scp complex subunit ScpB [Anaerolineae bacterium]